MDSIEFKEDFLQDYNQSSQHEYLETGDTGVYSSSSIAGLNTRKYHGVLVVRQPQIDHHSYVLLNALHESVLINGKLHELGSHQYPQVVHPKGFQFLKHFQLQKVPTWVYEVEGCLIQKELLCSNGKNQVLIHYTLLKGENIELNLKPFSSFRRIHKLRSASDINVDVVEVPNGISYQLNPEYDNLFIQGSVENKYIANKEWHNNAEYLVELDRGYDFQEDLYTVGELTFCLTKENSIVVSASTEEVQVETIKKTFESELKGRPNLDSLLSYLNKAADQFISKSSKGNEVCAGYHWFGRWGRDTFLSLPGLTIARDQPEICRVVIKTMLKDLKGGLLTNIGVGKAARYNSADASLWFFWALQEYADATGNHVEVWEEFKNEINHILENYREGTLYNIHMKESGLLYGGQEDVALTWMDAMVDGFPVTPRAGYTVELNALWYHAICFSIELAQKSGDTSFVGKWEEWPSKIKSAFKAMFWSEDKGYLADACEENEKDWSFRPNQVFATSLKYSVCDENMSASLLKKVEEKLLTPRGLRTLSQDDEKYIGIYKGDQKTRDNSYHQGIVWPWLLGHFAAGYMRVFKDSSLTLLRKIYQNFEEDLQQYGLGSIAEIYDAEPPYAPKGTISQAWSVSELLRIKKLLDQHKVKN